MSLLTTCRTDACTAGPSPGTPDVTFQNIFLENKSSMQGIPYRYVEFYTNVRNVPVENIKGCVASRGAILVQCFVVRVVRGVTQQLFWFVSREPFKTTLTPFGSTSPMWTRLVTRIWRICVGVTDC
jgi:hypothetical protein